MKKISLPKMLCVGVASVALLTYVSCGNRGVEEAVEPFDPNTEYQLTFGVFGDLERAYTEVINSPEFKQALPNITIEFQTADFNGHHTRLTTVMAAGEQTSDIEALEVVYIAQFVEGDGLRDLSAPPFNSSEVTADLVDYAVTSGQTAEGSQYAIPVDVAPAVLFYREELVRQSGVDPAEIQNLRDWDHYIEIGRQLTIDIDNDGKIDQYALPHANDAALIPLNGGKSGWFTADGTPLEPKDKYIASLELVKAIRDAGIDGDLGSWSGPWIDSFNNGSVVTTVLGSWFGGALKTWIAPEVTDWRVAYLPGQFPATSGGTYLVISKTVPGDRAAAAWEVIKYLVSSESAQISVFENIDAFPALETIYSHPVMSEPVDYFGGQPARQIFADIAQNVPPNVVHPHDSVANSVWGGAVSIVLNDEDTIENAYEGAKSQILALIY